MSDKRIRINAENLVCVCIDKVAGENYNGSFYTKYQKEPQYFQQLDQIILSIEKLLDALKLPRATQKSREFVEKNADESAKIANKKYWTDEEFANIDGNVATFFVLVKYRQKSTWQGEIFWKEKNVMAEFFSELELLKIIEATIQNLYTLE